MRRMSMQVFGGSASNSRAVARRQAAEAAAPGVSVAAPCLPATDQSHPALRHCESARTGAHHIAQAN